MHSFQHKLKSLFCLTNCVLFIVYLIHPQALQMHRQGGREESLENIARTYTNFAHTHTEFVCPNNTFVRNVIVIRQVYLFPCINCIYWKRSIRIHKFCVCVCVGKVCACAYNIFQTLFSPFLPTHL